MKIKLYFLLALLTLSLVIAVDPPELTEFHQFYGVIDNLPEGTYSLQVEIADKIFTTSVTEATYGYDPVFRVSGNNGDRIEFYVVNRLGSQTLVGTSTYQEDEVTELNLDYPSVEPTREEEAQVAEEEGLPLVEEDLCYYNWDCSNWSECKNKKQTRSCNRVDSCGADAVKSSKPTEERACFGSSQTQPVEDSEGTNWSLWVGIIIVILALIIIGFFFLRKRDEPTF